MALVVLFQICCIAEAGFKVKTLERGLWRDGIPDQVPFPTEGQYFWSKAVRTMRNNKLSGSHYAEVLKPMGSSTLGGTYTPSRFANAIPFPMVSIVGDLLIGYLFPKEPGNHYETTTADGFIGLRLITAKVVFSAQLTASKYSCHVATLTPLDYKVGGMGCLHAGRDLRKKGGKYQVGLARRLKVYHPMDRVIHLEKSVNPLAQNLPLNRRRQ